MSKPKLGLASSTRDFEQILALERRYHLNALSPDVQEREGFVFAEYSVALLRRMAAELPQAIAVVDGVVVGYCLALPARFRSELPELAPMFDRFGRCRYHGRPLPSFRFFVGGQVCVERAYRGRGLLAQLYERLRRSAPTGQELCVTEIAVRNQVSIRAHARAGFETISSYSDEREAWVIVAWNLGRSAAAR